jgi:hypothetical protein
MNDQEKTISDLQLRIEILKAQQQNTLKTASSENSKSKSRRLHESFFFKLIKNIFRKSIDRVLAVILESDFCKLQDVFVKNNSFLSGVNDEFKKV